MEILSFFSTLHLLSLISFSSDLKSNILGLISCSYESHSTFLVDESFNVDKLLCVPKVRAPYFSSTEMYYYKGRGVFNSV